MIRITLLALTLLSALAHGQTEASYGQTHRLRVSVEGTKRKVGFFVPKGLRKRAVVPLVIALPDGSGASGKAFKELGQFERMAFEGRFAVLSVDITTSSSEGWHPKDAIAMERDAEAVLAALDAAKKRAAELGFSIDPSAIAVRGHSGACYLAIWIGTRRPDLFFVIALNGVPKWFPDFLAFEGEKDTKQRIHIYRGERDHVRVRRETDKTIEELKKAGYTRIETDDIKGMAHETKPEVFVKWYSALLKKTAKPRKDAAKIAVEVGKLEEALKAGKPGTFGKIVKLTEKEKKAGFGSTAATLLAACNKQAETALKAIEDQAAENKLIEAAAAYKAFTKKYNGLATAKTAKTLRSKLIKSDDYKAMELFEKARALKEKGQDEKADVILVQITEKYPETVAAEKAEALLKG